MEQKERRNGSLALVVDCSKAVAPGKNRRERTPSPPRPRSRLLISSSNNRSAPRRSSRHRRTLRRHLIASIRTSRPGMATMIQGQERVHINIYSNIIINHQRRRRRTGTVRRERTHPFRRNDSRHTTRSTDRRRTSISINRHPQCTRGL